jgi:hypothetical protein
VVAEGDDFVGTELDVGVETDVVAVGAVVAAGWEHATSSPISTKPSKIDHNVLFINSSSFFIYLHCGTVM